MMDSARTSPAELRTLAAKLRALADQIEPESLGVPEEGSSQRQLSPLLAVEKNAGAFIALARAEYAARADRTNSFAPGLLGEPAWDMLLDLFINSLMNRSVSITSACIAAQAPATTGLRYIRALEVDGLVKRFPSKFDQRVKYIELTQRGILVLARYFVKAPISKAREILSSEHELSLIKAKLD